MSSDALSLVSAAGKAHKGHPRLGAGLPSRSRGEADGEALAPLLASLVKLDVLNDRRAETGKNTVIMKIVLMVNNDDNNSNNDNNNINNVLMVIMINITITYHKIKKTTCNDDNTMTQ